MEELRWRRVHFEVVEEGGGGSGRLPEEWILGLSREGCVELARLGREARKLLRVLENSEQFYVDRVQRL